MGCAVGRYEYIDEVKEGLIGVQNNDNWGFINTQGKVVIPFIYDNVGDFHNGLAKVTKNDKAGFINIQGKVVVPLIYDYAGDFHDGLASVRKNGKEGFINTQGKVVIPFVYDVADAFYQGVAPVYQDDELFLINREGKKIATIQGGDYYGRFRTSDGLIAFCSSDVYGDDYYLHFVDNFGNHSQAISTGYKNICTSFGAAGAGVKYAMDYNGFIDIGYFLNF